MPNIVEAASMDAIYRGQAFGAVAQALMAHNMNPRGLRTNDTLRKDEWKALDEELVKIATLRLPVARGLISRGLVYNINDGLGTTVLQYEKESDMSAAELNMDATTTGSEDRATYEIASLPLPVTHKSFRLNIRVLNASRKLGQAMDTTNVAIAMRKVAELIEDVTVNGSGTFTYGGGSLYGMANFPSRNQVTLAANWDDSAKTGAMILDDVIDMKQASLDDRHYGPWGLYVPTNYEAKLDEDFKANSDLTIRQRLEQVNNIEFVQVADKLTADNVLLVELMPETMRMVVGLQPQVVEWESHGGLQSHFKVISIMVPQPRADKDGRCGIVHLAA